MSKKEQLIKWYYYLYYSVYKFGKYISDDSRNESKPFIAINFLEFLILMQGWVWYVIYSKADILSNWDTLILAILVISIGIMNYRVFISANKWKRYVPEFEGLSKKERTTKNLTVIFCFIIVLAGTIYSLYRFSLVKWNDSV